MNLNRYNRILKRIDDYHLSRDASQRRRILDLIIRFALNREDRNYLTSRLYRRNTHVS